MYNRNYMSKVISDPNRIDELLNSRYIEAVFPSKEKAGEIFKSGKRLSFYWGIDPTGPDVHLGHSTNLFVLKKLTGLGHKVILLMGGFTARIGDPTGRDLTRRPLSEKEINANMRTYLEQVTKVLPKGSFKVKNNRSWLKKMSFEDLIKLASHFTVQQMIAREMFQKRIQEQKPVSLNEFLYPLMQGYDSVAMQIDGEIGGNDQTFNMLAGRELEKSILNKEKIVITTKLLEDPVTGKKLMSKSEGHYISMNDKPDDLFGKIMAMPDHAIVTLFSYITEVPDEKIEEIKKRLENKENPKNLKEELAFELVRTYYGENQAQKSKNEFKRVFAKGKLPDKIEEFKVTGGSMPLILILVGWLKISKSEAKTLLDEKAVKINDEVVTGWDYKVKPGEVIKVGPRKFVITI